MKYLPALVYFVAAVCGGYALSIIIYLSYTA